jgi:hypothetical protein
MGRSAVALLAVTLGAFAAACGGGGDGLSGEEVADRVADAVQEPGMVYHAVGSDNSEVWLDPENEVFRRRESTEGGELVSVGEGWVRWAYDPFENAVVEDDSTPQGEVRPRIDNPMVLWLEALGALAFGQELDVIGQTQADGQTVLALEAKTPVVQDGVPTGATLVGRVEVHPDTYFPLAFERSEEAPAGATPSQERARVRYTTSELIPRDELPEGFFDLSVVEGQVKTTEEELAAIREMGLIPYWLGEGYESQLGQLELPPTDSVFRDTTTSMAELHYALIAGAGQTTGAEPLLDSVIVRLGLDPSAFGPPVIPEVAGSLPETEREVMVRGGTGMLYTSVLTPVDVGCGEEECPETTARIYRRLVLTLEGTAVQIETFARVSPAGDDNNGYNTEFGITALAETLYEIEEDGS